MEQDKTIVEEETGSPNKRERAEDESQEESPPKKLAIQSNVNEEIVPTIVQKRKNLQVIPLDHVKFLLSILRYLNFRDLKSCRLVNKKWKDIAGYTILKRDCCRVQFKNNNQFLHHFEILKKSSRLPATDFIFYNLNGDQMKVLSFSFGSRIKKLSILYDYDGLNRFLNYIVNFLKFSSNYKSLEELTVQSFWSMAINASCLDLSHESFPQLKRLTISEFGKELKNLHLSRYSIIYQIILYASKLERVDNFCLSGSISLPLRFWTDKIGMMKKITIPGIEQNLSMQDVACFADFEPKIEHLSIKEQHRDHNFMSQIFKIIKKCRDSLQTLEISSPISLPNKLGIPTLTNLTTLSLLINSRSWNLSSFFNETYLRNCPNGNEMQKICPQLKTIRFQFLLNDGANFEEYKKYHYAPLEPLFGTFTNNFKSVENLELLIRGTHFVNLRSGWLDRCKELFPNIKRVTMDPRINVVSNFTKLYELWPDLTSVKMMINMWSWYQNEHGNFPCSLDRVLNGLPEALCAFFEHNSNPVVLNLNEILKQRNFPALYSFQDLKKFELVVGIRHYHGLRGFPMTVFAFGLGPSMNPKLRPVIRFDFNSPTAQSFWKLMEPFAQYVDFAHEPEEIDKGYCPACKKPSS